MSVDKLEIDSVLFVWDPNNHSISNYLYQQSLLFQHSQYRNSKYHNFSIFIRFVCDIFIVFFCRGHRNIWILLFLNGKHSEKTNSQFFIVFFFPENC